MNNLMWASALRLVEDEPVAPRGSRQPVAYFIVEGHLAPGIRVPERELCERFNVSRTPLREALKVLAAEGLIELLPNRGAHMCRLRNSANLAAGTASDAMREDEWTVTLKRR